MSLACPPPLGLLLSLLTAAPLLPESGETVSRLTFEELETEVPPAGTRLEIAGRYMELQDRELVLFEAPVRLVVAHDRVLPVVLSLRAGQDNVSCTARVTGGLKEGQPVLEVLAAAEGPGDAELFRSALERLAGRGQGGAALLVRLARRITRFAGRFGAQELQELARTACREALRLEAARLPANDAAARLEGVRRIHEALGDRRFTISLLAELDRELPGEDEIRRFLLELGGRWFRGGWLPYEDFKRAQGFEPVGSKWLLGREVAFLKAIHEFQLSRGKDAILRHRMDEEYQLLAQRGEVALGMTPREVHHALGYPDLVVRKTLGGQVFTQWIYGDRYYYFHQDQLFRAPESGAGRAGGQRGGG